MGQKGLKLAFWPKIAVLAELGVPLQKKIRYVVFDGFPNPLFFNCLKPIGTPTWRTHLFLMVKQPKFGDHILYTLCTQAGDCKCLGFFWGWHFPILVSIAHLNYLFIEKHKKISPLLKNPKAVKSFSIKSLSLSSVSWRLLMFCFSFQICSKI